MDKIFFKSGDLITDGAGKGLYRLLAPAKYNDKYYVAHAVNVGTESECLLKFAEQKDDSYKLNNLKREGDFRFYYPYIERVYGNFSGCAPDGGMIYGVELEFIHGRDLKDFRVELEKKVVFDKLSEEEAEWIIFRQMLQFLYGMRYYTEFSAQTYLHRDIKPENIMITDGEDIPVIVDFDFAHIAGSDRTIRIAGWDVAFSRGYTSPYIFSDRGQAAGDISTDIYSAGRLMFYWLNGKQYYTEEQMEVTKSGQLSSTVYCQDERLGYGIEANINRWKKKYLGDSYKDFRNILERMCCNPLKARPYAGVTEIISDMEAFLLKLCHGSHMELEQRLGTCSWRLLMDHSMYNNREYVMVAYKADGGVKTGRPLYNNTIRDVVLDGRHMFSLCNCDGTITYIPDMGRETEVHRGLAQKTDITDEYVINNGDTLLCDGISFEFTIVGCS